MTLLIVLFLVALGGALLTFFSGFGLGTLLLPLFVLICGPFEGVFAVAVVHLCNSILKCALTWKDISARVLWRFAPGAFVGALLGSWLLREISGMQVAYTHSFFGEPRTVYTISLVIGGLMVLFALLELFWENKLPALPEKYLFAGGTLSGFFGGLSGQQGALRTAFLLRSGLSKEAFIATGIACALVVDLTRIPLYLKALPPGSETPYQAMSVAMAGAVLGSVGGWYLLRKRTLKSVKYIAGICLVLFGLAMILGF